MNTLEFPLLRYFIFLSLWLPGALPGASEPAGKTCAQVLADLGRFPAVPGGVTRAFLAAPPTPDETAAMIHWLAADGSEGIRTAPPGAGIIYAAVPIAARDYYRGLLRVLGYRPDADYQERDLATFARTKGLTRGMHVAVFTRDVMAIATIEALRAPIKGATTTLAAHLVGKKILQAANLPAIETAAFRAGLWPERAFGVWDDIARFETWINRRVDCVKMGLRGNTWDEWESTPDSWLYSEALRGRRLVINYNPFPRKAGCTLADAAAGKYDEQHLAMLRKIIESNHSESILCLAHEFNGDWFAWSATRNRAADYVAMYRHLVGLAKKHFPDAPLRWAWLKSGEAPYDACAIEPCFPGDDCVDIIGLDLYDKSTEVAYGSSPDWPVRRWKYFLERPEGLNWLVKFAATHGKPLGIGEWGMWSDLGKPKAPLNGWDNPHYIGKMHEWILTHNVEFHVYFNTDHGDHGVDHSLNSTLNNHPESSRRFHELFKAR